MTNFDYEVKYLENGKLRISSWQSGTKRVEVEKTDIPFGKRIKCTFKTDHKIEFVSATMSLPFVYKTDDRIMINGYQSWSKAYETTIDRKEKPLGFLQNITNPIFHIKNYGDSIFYNNKNQVGVLHSHTYTYVRRGETYTFFGSTTEKNGYVYFETDAMRGLMNAVIDVKGYECDKDKVLFDIVILEGIEAEVFDGYFEQMGIEKPKTKKIKGFSSWYNYYLNVTENDVLTAIDNFSKLETRCDIIQIDDGYEAAVGDWKKQNKTKFPSEFKDTIAKIKDKGFLAGLWLAPFVCEKKSEVFEKHQDWLVKNKNGKPLCAGMNWSGIYVLDINKSEVREYIKNCFDYVFDELKVDLVKLDFLYAVAIIVPKNKTRGEVMREGMEFLRECCRDKLILGCGVPLGSAFGLVDYCRIGADVDLMWEDSFMMKHAHNECTSTTNTYRSTIARRQLNGRAFMNDPDIFHIREDNLKFSDSEKEVLRTTNALLGGVVFTSDDPSKYQKDNMIEKLNDTFCLADAEVVKVKTITNMAVIIDARLNGEDKRFYINGEDNAVEMDGVEIAGKTVKRV